MMSFISRARRAMAKACLPVVVLALTACTVLPESETLTFYRLPAPTAAMSESSASRGPESDAVLRIATPYGNRAIDSARILVVPEPERISAYKGARWTDTAPVLLRDAVIESFRASGKFRSIIADSGSLRADLELSSDLSQFHVVYRAGAPVVMISLDATLVETSSSRILASRRFDIEQPVDGKEVPEVVRAFGIAVEQLSRRLLTWTQDQARTRANG